MPSNLDLIRSDIWKKERTRIARRIRRGLHVQETNPGPDFKLRFDYIVTAAEVTKLVEDIMIETERLIKWQLKKQS